MSLHKKTLIIIFITFIALGLLGYISMHLTLFKSYRNMEADNIKQHVQRIENRINDELIYLEKVAADWGYWSDTYNFIMGKNDNYEEDNYDVETLLNLELNLMLLTDRQTNNVLQYLIDLEREEKVDNPDFLTKFIELYPEIFQDLDEFEPTSTIVMLPEGPMLLAIIPVLQNDKSGPSAGNLILGKYLNEELVNKISCAAKLSAKIYNYEDKDKSDLPPEAKLQLLQDTTKVTVPKNSEEISGFALIHDYLNKPILILEVTVKRDLLAKAWESFTLFALIFIVAILVVMFVTNYVLNRFIIKRVIHLSNQAKKIADSGEFERDLKINGSDEITKLGDTFNLMLKSLNESHKEVMEINQHLEDKVENRTNALKASNDNLQSEILERKKVQVQLEASLAEKDILLKEVYHRVKNNLQVITSLLNLQAGQSKNEEVKSALQASKSRVYSMSLVHEQLYQNDSLQYISAKRYLNSIVSYLFGLYNTNSSVSFEVICEDINMTVNQVIPCGLIVAELVSNSLKYAFKGRESGKVLVKLMSQEDKHATLEISDNGKGMPNDFDPQTSNSLGLTLVNSLALQLGGKLVTDLENSKFTITFKFVDGEE